MRGAALKEEEEDEVRRRRRSKRSSSRVEQHSFVARVVVSFFLVCCCVRAGPVHPLPLRKEITLGSYIGYYEAAIYDTSSLRDHRRRVRRDTEKVGDEYPLILPIRTLNKKWTIRLVRDDGIFAKDVVLENTDGQIAFDTTHSYVGSVLEDENSLVQGIITKEGLFDGTIVTNLEEYYIEPSNRYLSNDDTSPPYHSIAYRSSDVVKPPQPLRCASHELYKKSRRNDSFQREPFYEHLFDHELVNHGGFYSNEPRFPQFSSDFLNKRYSFERFTRNLQKRATVDPRKTTCMLYLQADHQFFARYGTEESCIEVMTRHVQRVNSIYRHTDFNQDGRADNISFMIKRVKVHSGDALRDPSYRFPGNYGVEKYLELFSEEDYDAFCLAYMFTYRDFEMGTLGLAWTGDLKNAGGVCEKNGHYRGSMKSLNTGIVTLLNYGKHVPPAVSHVTLAHEIGHNFGSPHDPEQCTPGGEDGNFIMFARATSGDKRNNNRFSPCSLSAINPVLNTKARSPKGCFTEPQVSLCGNGVVEEGEECDCGWEEDCKDSCCFPQRRYPPAEETPCTLTPGSVCSPSQGPCCTSECKLKFGDRCRDDNGCRDASFCDGRNAHCPPSVNKPNKTICNRELVCFMGECTGSICLAYGLESCQCIPGPNEPATKSCELCCRLPGESQPCLSSFEWNSPPYDIPDMFAKPGTPCNDYNGYCDVFQKCREVDPSGPLATLRKLLLSDESLATFRRWVADHWYAAVLIVFLVVSLLVASTRLLGKRSDLKLKSVTIIHSSTTETVRLPPEGTEGVTVHPPAVRAKLPLSRKVREKRQRRKQRKETSVAPVSVPDSKDLGRKGSSSQQQQQKRLPSTTTTTTVAAATTATTMVTSPGAAAITATTTTTTIPAIAPTTTTIPIIPTIPATKLEMPKLQLQQQQRKRIRDKSENNDKRKRDKRKRVQEVIDYSASQKDDVAKPPKTDPRSKVRSWLLASAQCVPETVRSSSSSCKQNLGLPKSKSSPGELTGPTGKQTNRQQQQQQQQQQYRKSPARVTMVNENRSSGKNLTILSPGRNDRARLQVVYKPPFRFCVRLRKADKVAQAPVLRSSKAQCPRTGVLLKRKKDHSGKNGKRTNGIGAGSKHTGVVLGSSSDKRRCEIMPNLEPANSDLHTVPSDLEVLLSESEFLFSDA